jgi:hypothetical protein
MNVELRKSFLLRMDPALWAELEHWAQQELRSVNGQIEYVLKQAVAKRKGAAAQERELDSQRRRKGETKRSA